MNELNLPLVTVSIPVSSKTEALHIVQNWPDMVANQQHIVLSNQDLELFARNFDVSQAPAILSVSISIECPAKPDSAEGEALAMTEGSSITQQLWKGLEQVIENVGYMSQLTTCSLRVSRKSTVDPGFWVPRPLLARLVDALPQSCVNLEIDTSGMDFYAPGSAHLCDNIRAFLPRARNLRIRLSTLCHAMLKAAPTPPEPMEYPLNLETLVINCIPRTIYGSQSLACGSFSETRSTYFRNDGTEASTFLAATLASMNSRAELPSAKCLRIVDAPAHDEDRSVYATLNRRDVIDDLSWSMPFRDIGPFGARDGFLMRTVDRGEVISFPWALEVLAEGQPWIEKPGGHRAPRNWDEDLSLTLPSGAANVIPLSSSEEWKAAHPKKSCSLWRNERLTGMRLLEVGKNHGVLARVPVVEQTPSGFIREDADLYSREEWRGT